MKIIVVDAKAVELDDEGYFVNPAEWNLGIAEELAKREQINLTDSHWGLIDAVREFYLTNHTHPSGNALVRWLGQHLNEKPADKRKDINQHLYELFPLGPDKQLAKLAGLPKPLPSSTEG